MLCFCGNDIPLFYNVMWCDDCIDEFVALPKSKDAVEFIKMKESLRRKNALDRLSELSKDLPLV